MLEWSVQVFESFQNQFFAFSSHAKLEPERKPVHSFMSTHILPSPFPGFQNIQLKGIIINGLSIYKFVNPRPS